MKKPVAQCRHFIFLLAIAICASINLYADWRIKLTITNQGSDDSISASVFLGESEGAADGLDTYDFPLGPPPNNLPYIRAYFPHNDWGSTFNGNYIKDIRSINPAAKTWNFTFSITGTPLSNNYRLSWNITGLFPACYQPRLVFNSQNINMLTQSSYLYTGWVTSGSIQMQYNNAMPYQVLTLPELLFSDNLTKGLNLNRYFKVGSGTLNFNCHPNANLVQNLVTLQDSVWLNIYPVAGFVGTTIAEISVIGSGGTLNAQISVIRDATNSPPVYLDAIQPLPIIQNQQGIFSWAGKVFDPDLDALTINFSGGENISIEPDETLQQAAVIPDAGFKGETVFQFSLSDENHSPAIYEIPVNVLPAVPSSPQNLVLQLLPENSLLLTWQTVNTDTLGLPVFGLKYKVMLYADSAGTQLINQYTDISASQIIIPEAGEKMFIKVIAVNE
ncbi:MAG TPA: hypothetical protein PL116_06115 [Candidatus Cloacimonas sp.]|nr:hypothetical protein [Candidatus Cloacimonas sp.]